jgi:hypothetical protein
MADPAPGVTLDQQVAAILAAWRDRYICPPEGHADALARVAAGVIERLREEATGA